MNIISNILIKSMMIFHSLIIGTIEDALSSWLYSVRPIMIDDAYVNNKVNFDAQDNHKALTY